MDNKFSFYKKNTKLNNVFKNINISFSDNKELLEKYANEKETLYTVSNQYNNEYIDDVEKVIPEYGRSLLDILSNNFKNYYKSKELLSKELITKNIKRYNNSSTYCNTSEYIIPNSFILDYSYNTYSLYYATNNNLSLLSYNILLKNGFNYDKENHIIHFNIDNKYIKNIKNNLYFNYNIINNQDINEYGLFSFNKSETIVDNKSNLLLNTEFKHNIYSNIKKLKKLYDDSNYIYKKLDFYYNNENYDDMLSLDIFKENIKEDYYILSYFENNETSIKIHKNNVKQSKDSNNNDIYITNFIKINNNYEEVEPIDNPTDENYIYKYNLSANRNLISYMTTYISYELAIQYIDSNLYFSDNNYEVNDLNISSENTIYVKNINTCLFKLKNNIDNININNYNIFQNKSSITHLQKNNININYTYNSNNYNKSEEVDGDIKYYNVINEISYNLKINNSIDNNIFINSGLTIEYKESPYISSINDIPEEYDYGEGKLIFENNKYKLYRIKYEKYKQFIYIPLTKQLNINYNNNNIYKNYKTNKSILNKDTNTTYYILSSKNLFSSYIGDIYTENIGRYLYSNNLNNYIDMNIDIADLCHYEINNYITEYLLSNNIIYNSYNLHYYSTYNYLENRYNYYPLLSKYPIKYLNDNFFNYININTIPNNSLLDICLSDIKDNDNNILYLYEISLNQNSSYISFLREKNINTTINYINQFNNDDNIKTLFHTYINSYINSKYIDINSIININDNSYNFNTSIIKKYITSYSNNFIKFI